MRREPEDFGDEIVELVQISRSLREAQAVEDLLTAEGIEYAVTTDRYHASFLFIFPTTRIGAFFYVRSEQAESCRALLSSNRFQVVAVDDD